MVTIKNLALFGSTLFASGVFGNIMFPKPEVHCSDHCPRGMSCGAEGMCLMPFHPSVVPENHHTRRRAVKGSTVRHTPLVPRQAYSTNGQCGAANGNTICNPASTVYTGSCCSAAGWCGNTAAHCGTGCQSGCGATPPPTTPPAAGTPTTDGSCGSTNGGTTCAGWGTGECCSMYGWCGNSPGHCGAGCQNGPCTGGGGGGGGNPGGAPGPAPAPAHPTPGAFTILPQRAGVPAMHAALVPNGKVVFLDKVEDYTEVRLPNGRFAYSSEYDASGNVAPVPLSYTTNAFCSGGTFLANGDLLAIGGNGPLTWLDPTVGDGFRGLRLLSRRYNDASLNGQSWRENIGQINSARWYPSAQTLADGRVFVASGSLNGLDPTVLANNNPTWELLNADGRAAGSGSIQMPLLVANQPYYMYPFMHLLNNGQLFVFTSRSSVAINPINGAVQRTYPDLAGDYRTYPNTGGSVMLPLSAANNWNNKIMICGGGAYQDITSPTDPSCGLIDPLAANPTWEYESMPQGRGMVEGVLLPDGSVIWLNGANKGAQGFLLAEDPTLSALLYTPTRPAGQRFQTLAASTIPRLYHSVALLLLDGTVMIAGSSPNEMPVLTPSAAAPYITDFRVERYTPPYLSGANANRRPSISYIQVRTWSINATFTVKLNFSVPTGVTVTNDNIRIVLYHGGFVTHSVHMGHRMVILSHTGYKTGNSQSLTVSMPPNRNIVPPGPYVLYVVVNGVPSVGQFVMVRND